MACEYISSFKVITYIDYIFFFFADASTSREKPDKTSISPEAAEEKVRPMKADKVEAAAAPAQVPVLYCSTKSGSLGE